jgi:hypothetical protein
MTHQALNMTEFTEINNQIRNENSRTVKICLVKYKCVIIVTLMILCFVQFIFWSMDKFSKDSDVIENFRIISKWLTNVNVELQNSTVIK